ncbi:MAG: 16S rRNA (guanine(966)-N(2))-methyltransferase RsmD [Elusimicrobia bacterium]|jgi:16S rRNA (guanine966-N2)-methyltransferase|nr:16S rRNA (guanine(966)-N(2))-methyltransferase RsmD [Elusimicrobiota bacterium]
MPTIVTGKYKGRNLENIPGKSVRPISGMIKEALFSKLAAKIKDAVFLDVFAGTGSVGIEALSRGAKKVVFVEKDPVMVEMLNKNLSIVDDSDNYKVVKTDFFSYDFKEFSRNYPDIIFTGPPYKDNLSDKILKYCHRRCYSKKTLLIIQHFHGEKASHPGYKKIDSRKYGISRLDYFTGID